jgi:hypothetical protein
MANIETKLPNVLLEEWLAPKELAAHFGLAEDSAYRWISEGTLPRRFVRFCGRRRMLIHPSAIQELERQFESSHE